MGTQDAATGLLDEPVSGVRRYHDLTRRLDDRLSEAEALRDEGARLRVNIEGRVAALKSLAANVADEATRKCFLVLADCFGAANE